LFNSTVFKQAFQDSIPVMFGYVPLGAAFGLLFSQLGYHWLYAVSMSLIIFAGAAQFLAVGLLAAQASLIEISVAIFILNARHIFFGLSLITRYQAIVGWRKIYVMFGLTDETYSLLTSHPIKNPMEDQTYALYLTALNQSYWVIGSVIGLLLGGNLNIDTTGMDFALTALFVVLMIEQFKTVQCWSPFIIALVSGALVLVVIGQDNMLMLSILLSIAILLIQGKPWKVPTI